jgi:hypothetical protein
MCYGRLISDLSLVLPCQAPCKQEGKEKKKVGLLFEFDYGLTC